MRFYSFTNNEPINIPHWTGKLSEHSRNGDCHVNEVARRFAYSANLFLSVKFSSGEMCLLACCDLASVASCSLRPHGLYPTKLLCPWDSPGKNTGVGCHALLQGIFPGIEPAFPKLQADSSPPEPPRKPLFSHKKEQIWASWTEVEEPRVSYTE